ncbi:hypothetical protein ARMGADRAFT_1089215 [Armillaria gallica]|uniref:Uncharacterized protein n=1 Tax=Armillaria gallica TaxID=47427 RepID=A0A2H3CWM5_ARMGA|nr:hypothetical protein ARMGADRAFT_1089215 [Armillaria gallica]
MSTEYLHGHANYIPNEDYDPPPISIFVQTSNPPGLVHYMMMPIITPYTKSIAYTVEGNTFTQQSRNNKGEYHILPGIHHALVYKTVHDNTTQTWGILELQHYMSKQRPHPAYVPPFRVQPRQPLLHRYATDSTWRPIPVYLSIALLNEILQWICMVGLDPITWEEGTGHICISSRDGKVVVLDIGKCTPTKETISILDQKAINIHLFLASPKTSQACAVISASRIISLHNDEIRMTLFSEFEGMLYCPVVPGGFAEQ